MGILNRLRNRIDTLAASSLPMLANDDDRLRFSAELPAGMFGSLLKLDVQLETEAHGDGERVRMRARIQSNLASVLKPMLSAPHPAGQKRIRGSKSKRGTSRALASREMLGDLATRSARRAFSNPLVRRMAEPLMQHDINNWIEVVASSASLDRGAQDLIPHHEKLAALGIRPAKKDGPHVESWSAQIAQGLAQVSTLQLDKDSLPERLQKQLGHQPFNLAAMIISTLEEK